MAGRTQVSQYGALVGRGARFAGIDQGIDFTGGPFPVYALGDGKITRIERSGSGWPGQGAVLNYQIETGPAAGRYVYVAEDFAPDPSLKVGSKVSKGGILGLATGSGLAPGIEIGWADASGIPTAPRPPARPAPQFTTQGADFDKFAQTGIPVDSRLTAQPPRPGSSGGGSSFWGGIEGALGGAVSGVEGAAGTAMGDLEALIKGPADFLKAMLWLVNPLTWLRAVEGLFGFALLFGGIAIALGADKALQSVPGPTGSEKYGGVVGGVTFGVTPLTVTTSVFAPS